MGNLDPTVGAYDSVAFAVMCRGLTNLSIVVFNRLSNAIQSTRNTYVLRKEYLSNCRVRSYIYPSCGLQLIEFYSRCWSTIGGKLPTLSATLLGYSYYLL